jgi:hypothetical protein
MKKFAHKVQALGNKAAQIKAAIESLPPRVAEMREAVAATAGQFQQLRSEVQSDITTLRADSEEKLIDTLREIDAGAAAFREAGYALEDVEMELGLPQRLIVHMAKFEDVPHHHVRSIVAANEGKKAMHAILSALLKAEELADRVDLTNLTYHKLMVYVGPLPVVRLCWCANAAEQPLHSPESAPSAASPTQPASAFPSSSIFGAGSFFEKRSPAVSTPAPDSLPAAQQLSPTHAPPSTVSAPTPDEREDPLARFKKMPDLSRRRH